MQALQKLSAIAFRKAEAAQATQRCDGWVAVAVAVAAAVVMASIDSEARGSEHGVCARPSRFFLVAGSEKSSV
jgi:hypothetical protein